MAHVNPWKITETTDGRLFAYGHPPGDYNASPIFEVTSGQAKLVHTLKGVEGIIGLGKQLLCVGSSFEAGPQVHILDGKKWSTHLTGHASIHVLRIIDGKLIGAGRDGAVATWDAKNRTWKLRTTLSDGLHLTDMISHDGELVVAGQTRKRTGIVGTVAGKKIEPWRLPTKAELHNIGTLAGERIIATGDDATVIVGTADQLILVPPGKFKPSAKNKRVFGTPLEWEGRVLIAARDDGVLELVDGELRPFSKAPASRLSTVGGRLWRIHGKAGMGYWNKSDWKAVPLST